MAEEQVPCGPPPPADYLAPFETFQAYALRGGMMYRGRIRAEFAEDEERLRRLLAAAPGTVRLEEVDGRLYATIRTYAGRRPSRNLWLHATLLLLTSLTVLAAGGNLAVGIWGHATTVWPFEGVVEAVAWAADGQGEAFVQGRLPDYLELLRAGIPYAAALLFVLLAHEMGHYLVSRRHGVDATLPYLLPAPVLFGTFGAVIRMRSPIVHRRALFDIGVAGPIAGLVASVIVCVIGLARSEFLIESAGGGLRLGEPLLLQALVRLVMGPVPANHDVLLHPVALAGWFGFFVTFLNLMPLGQLDGGHLWYALIGRRQRYVGWTAFVLLLGMGAIFPGWLVLAAVVLLLLRVGHPPVMDESVPLGRSRAVVGIILIAVFVLLFIPEPVALR